MEKMTMAEINCLGRGEFTAALGAIFEDSPWVAERTWKHMPFESLDRLCERMNGEVEAAQREEQAALLRAHPDLGTRAKVSVDSAREQAGAGLDRLTADEYGRLVALNDRYRARFGFPFLYAVKGSDKFMILEALERRVENAPEDEFQEALRQVFRIARFRLEEKIER
jgi:2-oxo-4-hydroxy-4-carboxy-5-ureidoimidazoline decarboxylase